MKVIRVPWFVWILIAVVAVGAGWLTRPSQGHYIPARTATALEASDEISLDQWSPAEKERWRAERSDLAAQWRMADAAWIALWVGGTGLLFIAMTLIETRAAAATARDMFELERPWLVFGGARPGVLPLGHEDSVDEDGQPFAALTVFTHFENIGRLAARDVRTMVEKHVLPIDAPAPRPPESVTFEGAGATARINKPLPAALAQFTADELQKFKTGQVNIFLTMAVEYRSVNSSTLRTTTLVIQGEHQGMFRHRGELVPQITWRQSEHPPLIT